MSENTEIITKLDRVMKCAVLEYSRRVSAIVLTMTDALRKCLCEIDGKLRESIANMDDNGICTEGVFRSSTKYDEIWAAIPDYFLDSSQFPVDDFADYAMAIIANVSATLPGEKAIVPEADYRDGRRCDRAK
jgi:hypothetical protein